MVVEMMRAEWGCSLRQALFGESFPAAIALWPSLLARHGVESTAVDHVSAARQAAREKARTWLEENYEIVKTPRNSRPPE